MPMKKVLCLLFLATLSLSVFAQKVKTIVGEYTYVAPENVSPTDAKSYALNQAKLSALADEFGTIISQTNLTHVENSEDKTSTRFNTYGSSDVKGEWIETIGEPEYKVSYEQDQLVVFCRVKGKARELVASKVAVQAKVLRNGTEDRFESDEFKSGDELYLSFQTPVNGYLAVYLVDDSQLVQCLLPYSGQQDGIYQVKANKRYTLFSEKAAPQESVDEYVLTAEKAVENNQLYVIFSPNQFFKAVDAASTKTSESTKIGGFPREVSFDDFHKWLGKCQRSDKDMLLKKILITVKK